MKRIFTLLALLTISLVAFSQAGQFDSYLSDAKKFLKEGHYERAQTYYELYVELAGKKDTSFEMALANHNATPTIPYNEIWYTTTDGKSLTPKKSNAFGATIVSNTYTNGKGIIRFSRNVSKIGESAFGYCSSLQSITIPSSVTKIGEYAFCACSSLLSITIPNRVGSIGLGAFYGCSNLSNFSGKYASADGRCLIVNGDLVAFAPSGSTHYSIPSSVTKIGEYAFCACSTLQSITIPHSVTSIGNYAFGWCSSLQSVYCKSTTPPSGGSDMFDNNASDRKIYVLRGSVYAYTNAANWSKYADDIVGYDAEGSYATPAIPYNEIWYTTTDGKSVTPNQSDGFGATIVSNTYSNGKGVIRFSGNVSKIGEASFYGCSNLQSITIPNSVTSIGKEAFYSCSSLKSITIPNSVTEIGKWAFSLCSTLQSITIPNSVMKISSTAFWLCLSLKSVYCKSTTPPSGDTSMFSGNASGRKIYVPRGSERAYKNAENWSKYADAIVEYDAEGSYATPAPANGEYKTVTYTNGDRYEGYIVNGVRNGQGTYYFSNGNRYEGNYVNGVRNGQGTCYFSDGNRYEGNWKDDLKSGYGKLYWTDGDRYEGNFANDKRNGQGTYYYSNGTKLSGTWKDGEYVGE